MVDESLRSIVGMITKVRKSRGKVLATMKMLPTPMGKKVMKMLGMVDFFARGIGKLDDKNQVTDYKLTSIGCILK